MPSGEYCTHLIGLASFVSQIFLNIGIALLLLSFSLSMSFSFSSSMRSRSLNALVAYLLLLVACKSESSLLIENFTGSLLTLVSAFDWCCCWCWWVLLSASEVSFECELNVHSLMWPDWQPTSKRLLSQCHDMQMTGELSSMEPTWIHL